MPRPGDSQPEDAHRTVIVSRDLPFLMDDDWLQVRNDDSHPVEMAWARKRYIVQPAETAIVIFQALVNKLGDPRSEDNEIVRFDDGNGHHGVIMPRYSELIRLFALYGIREERLEDFHNPVTGEDMIGLLSAVPKLTVTTLTGQLVRFPCQDPTMMPYPVTNAGKRNVNSDTTRMLNSLQAENDELRRRQAETEQRLDAFFAAQQGTDTPEG